VGYTVGQLAGFAGVTVRTLHHYDEIGLLSPAGRSTSGYRAYDDADLDRLQQVLFYRELGFGLTEIASILAEPDTGAAEHLRRQHRLLTQRVERLQAMVAAVEKEMEAQDVGISLTPQERFEVFGDWLPEEYEAEAEQRWGGTEAYAPSQRRVSTYSKDDWLRIKVEGEDIEARLVAAQSAGEPADGTVAMDLVEEYRQHISRWYYDCGYDIHRGLGDMYVADPRFTDRYEAIAPGLAQYVRDASHANADRGEATG
jgi:DNA-binding transcriptional MerR regulator